jgi:hypothetical protein
MAGQNHKAKRFPYNRFPASNLGETPEFVLNHKPRYTRNKRNEKAGKLYQNFTVSLPEICFWPFIRRLKIGRSGLVRFGLGWPGAAGWLRSILVGMYPGLGATVLHGPPTLSGIAVLGATFDRNICLAILDSEFSAEASEWVVSDHKPPKTRKTRSEKQENFTKTLPFLYQKFVFGHLSATRCSPKRAKVQPWARGPMRRSIFSVCGIIVFILRQLYRVGLDICGPI